MEGDGTHALSLTGVSEFLPASAEPVGSFRAALGSEAPGAESEGGAGRRQYVSSDVVSVASTEASESDKEPAASSEELVLVCEWKALVDAEPGLMAAVDRFRAGECPTELFLRFARARKQSPGQPPRAALQLLQESLRYRDEHKLDRLALSPLHEVLCGMPEPSAASAAEAQQAFCDVVPHGLLGLDNESRVICYRNYGKLKLWELKHLGVGPESLTRHHLWLNEKCLQAMDHRGQFVQIIDIEGGFWQQAFAKSHLDFMQLLVPLDTKVYPDRLGQVYIINAPKFFAHTWNTISKLLDEKTRMKIRLLAGPEQWRAELSKIMDLSLLPRHMGGQTDLFAQSLTRPLAKAADSICYSPVSKCGPASAAAARDVDDAIEVTEVDALPPREEIGQPSSSSVLGSWWWCSLRCA
mmetsp:Transcript_46708/g.124870  ORF Transcript_46708/g.124870 Transcript_46708/m.124870 type:complete len:411 (+) Transcript_46708:77-1309(+)